jgi:hypothetical protein
MMPPTRKTAPEGITIIGLQIGKGFRLCSTPEHPPQRRRPTTSNAERMETVPRRRGGRATTPKTTQQRLQGGERRPQASSLLAYHSTGQSFRPKLLGMRQWPPATSVDRRQRQRMAPQPEEAPHDPRRPWAAPSHPRSRRGSPCPRLSSDEGHPATQGPAGGGRSTRNQG